MFWTLESTTNTTKDAYRLFPYLQPITHAEDLWLGVWPTDRWPRIAPPSMRPPAKAIAPISQAVQTLGLTSSNWCPRLGHAHKQLAFARAQGTKNQATAPRKSPSKWRRSKSSPESGLLTQVLLMHVFCDAIELNNPLPRVLHALNDGARTSLFCSQRGLDKKCFAVWK